MPKGFDPPDIFILNSGILGHPFPKTSINPFP